jgi:hypothetical protein
MTDCRGRRCFPVKNLHCLRSARGPRESQFSALTVRTHLPPIDADARVTPATDTHLCITRSPVALTRRERHARRAIVPLPVSAQPKDG